ncbi:hypothetical protein L798_05735 [Zootermopsis nevadensis]|uniref:Gustatory receptor n=2 Tax=Zootermopsis nevadensis TaxID=136037 RepID=A0A067RKE6_ZOONE|nr:hypothetical protein L798_05735 [Zootermopsis nevadensis]
MDFRSSVLPLYYVSKLLGLAPFLFNKNVSVNREQKTSKLLSPSVIWSLFIFLSHFTAFLSIMIWSILYDYREYKLNVTVPDALTIFLMYGTCFASLLIGAVLSRNRVETVMTNFTAIDQILLQENRDGIYRKTRLILLIQLSVLVAFLVGFYCYHVYVWAYGTSYIYLISKDITNFSNTIMIIQYINIMQILRHRFRILNEHLSSSCGSKSLESHYSLIKHQNVINRPNFRTIQIENVANNSTETPISHSYYLSELPMTTNNQRPEEVLQIHTLRQAYSDLYDVTELINKIYGYQILLEVGYDFVSLVSYLYYALETLNVKMTVDHNQRGEESFILEVVSSLCWVTQNLVRVLCITGSCFAATEEARRTSTVVHKLLLRQSLKGDTSAELQLFSMQLLSNKVQFTAGGFFSVNLSLVYSMVGVATTYIIILLQFK